MLGRTKKSLNFSIAMAEAASSTQTSDENEVVESLDNVKSSESISVHEALRGNPIFVYLSALVHWKSPVESGLYFAILNLFFFLLTVGEYTFVSLVCYLLLGFLLLSGAYVHTTLLSKMFGSGKQSAQNPLKSWAVTEVELHQVDVEMHVSFVVLTGNAALNYARRVYTFANSLESIRFAFVVFVASLFGTFMSPAAICHALTIVAFVWPLVYRKKKAQIDALYDKAADKIGGLASKLIAMLSKKKKKVE
jgi:reticulon-1